MPHRLTACLLCLCSLLVAQDLDVPPFKRIRRLGPDDTPNRMERQTSCYIMATEEHPVSEAGYVIVTDHQGPKWLAALELLAQHHKAAIHRIDDFRALSEDAEAREALRGYLAGKQPRYVALAPRLESYGENCLLTMWSVLRQLDDDPQLDVFPGWLLAPDVESFGRLIQRSIGFQTPSPKNYSVFTIAQVVGATPNGLRSWQKAALMHQLFEDLDCTVGSVTLRTRKAQDAVLADLGPQALVQDQTRRGLFQEFSEPAGQGIEASQLLFLFGHGAPGMVCSTEVAAFHDLDLSDKVVLCGSCFSGAPLRFDYAPPGQGPDGSEIDDQRERFVLRAIEQGAVVAYGHLRLNGGFPQMFGAVEAWLHGASLGEGYQRLVNRLLAASRFSSPSAPLWLDADNTGERAKNARNGLLYLVIGDPALQPLPAMLE